VVHDAQGKGTGRKFGAPGSPRGLVACVSRKLVSATVLSLPHESQALEQAIPSVRGNGKVCYHGKYGMVISCVSTTPTLLGLLITF
jgi:hypothetical protein